MDKKLRTYVDTLVDEHEDKIVGIAALGSLYGLDDLNLSDVDLLIICRNSDDIRAVFNTAVELEKDVFDANPSLFTQWVQFHLLASNSFGGIHLIIIAMDEFDENYTLKSRRLRMSKVFVSRALLQYNIKNHYQNLYGKDILAESKIPRITSWDKITVFTFPAFLALMILVTVFDRHRFIIWCCKVIKYHYEGLFTYQEFARSQGYDASFIQKSFDTEVMELAKKYRYSPHEYKGNRLDIYFSFWKQLLNNLLKAISK